MNSYKLNTAVAFIVFNRPKTTSIVFEQIRKAKPTELFLIADGPRQNRPGEKDACDQVRKIVSNVDWNCQVHKNFSDENLGCKNRLSSGITWLFENVEKAIILEDDCFPDQSFFRFCDELLEVYKDSDEIMLISGNKVLPHKIQTDSSYYFSSFNHIWGWATWRRAWEHYDIKMKQWHEINQSEFLAGFVNNQEAVKFWKTLLNEVYVGKIDTWDYQWQYSTWLRNGFSVIPSRNLVINLGFNNQSTNTTSSGGLYSKMELESLSFPLKHPFRISRNFAADNLEVKLLHKFDYKEKIRRFLLRLGIKI
jgi:hypothetical protein